jgi:hypothetical protein
MPTVFILCFGFFTWALPNFTRRRRISLKKDANEKQRIARY